MAGRHYVLDTNVLIDWWSENYPPSVFPSVKDRLDEVVMSNRIHVIQHVWDEVHRIGDPELRSWCESNKSLIHRDSSGITLLRKADTIRKAYPSLIDHDPRAADPFLIAYAMDTGSVLVTHETEAATKSYGRREHYIPDVCREKNIIWMRFISVMKQEKWVI